jgi:tetratricopeptide (TPR) repeat protein
MTARRGPSRLLASLLLLSCCVPAWTARAMDDGGGRSVFATGAGNRALAMGGAFCALADDASAPIWNPAGLGRVQRRELQASQTTLFGLGFNEQYASFALPSWRWGTTSLTWRRFGVDGIEERDDRGFLLGDDLEDSETELALGYGRSLMDGDLALGGTLKLQRQALAGYQDSGVGMDLGIWARPLALAGSHLGLARQLALGLAIRNAIEPTIKLDQDNVPDPTAIRAGLAWAGDLASGLQLRLATDLEQTRGMDSRWHLGAEARLHDILAVRVGSSAGDLTAGLGLSWQGLGADYQYEDNPLGDIHRFGLAIRFGATVTESRQAAQAAAEAALQERLDSAFATRNRQREQQLVASTRTALDSGSWQRALDLIGTLTVLAPDRTDLDDLTATAWRGLARDQERSGDLTAAALSWRRVLTLTPDDARARDGLARVQAESDRRAERSREIRARFAAALDAFSSEDWFTARDGFAAILELSPDDTEAATMLDRTESAMTRRAAALAEEAVTLAQAGQLEIAGKRLEAARRLDAEAPGLAAATAEFDHQVVLATSRLATDRQRVQPTIEAPGAAVAAGLSPERRREIDDLYRRGLDAMAADRREEAARYWELVWSADPDHENVRELLAQEYLATGMEAYAGGGLRQAVASWEQALRVDPTDPRARGYLERAQQQLSRMEKIVGSR